MDRDRLVHTWEDITERKSTETEILRLNDQVAPKAADKYQTLFNSINEGFCPLEVRHDSNGALDDLVF
ncbi:hypothetical protein [Spirosoma pulveris]